MKSFLAPLLRAPKAVARLRNVRTGGVIADSIIPAFDSATRRKGLLSRESLPQGSALILAPCSAVHTWFMKFPIDIVFASKNGRVLKIRTAVPAWRIAGSLRAFAVIEMPAGTLESSSLIPGDQLTITID